MEQASGESEMLLSAGGDRPVGGRRRQLDVGTGVLTRVAPSLQIVRAEEADRSVGTTGNSVGGTPYFREIQVGEMSL